MNIETPEKKVRGELVVVKFGKFDGKDCYLNDAKRLHNLEEEANKKIEKYRELSRDMFINKKGKGIVQTPLLGFKRKEDNKFEAYPEKLEDALQSEEPVIIFGHGGQGKTILATELADRLLKPERNNPKFNRMYAHFKPIIINCRDINVEAEKAIKDRGKDMYTYLKESNGIGALPRTLLEDYKFCFIIDDYHNLIPEFRGGIENAVRRLKKEGNLVVLLSRLERTNIHPPETSGYKIIQIDTEGVAKEIDDFVKERIDKDKVEAFKEYLEKYDTSITGYFQTKSFLTMIFPRDKERESVLEYIIDPAIKEAIRGKKPLTRTQLYDAITDYLTGKDIKREHDTWGEEEIRNEIPKRKNQLAEKAFNDIFGKNLNETK